VQDTASSGVESGEQRLTLRGSLQWLDLIRPQNGLYLLRLPAPELRDRLVKATLPAERRSESQPCRGMRWIRQEQVPVEALRSLGLAQLDEAKTHHGEAMPGTGEQCAELVAQRECLVETRGLMEDECVRIEDRRSGPRVGPGSLERT